MPAPRVYDGFSPTEQSSKYRSPRHPCLEYGLMPASLCVSAHDLPAPPSKRIFPASWVGLVRSTKADAAPKTTIRRDFAKIRACVKCRLGASCNNTKQAERGLLSCAGYMLRYARLLWPPGEGDTGSHLLLDDTCTYSKYSKAIRAYLDQEGRRRRGAGLGVSTLKRSHGLEMVSYLPRPSHAA